MNYHLVFKERIIPFLIKSLGLILVLLALLTPKKGSAQSVSLSVKQSSLENVLDEISKQTKYDFSYTDQALKMARPVSITLRNTSLVSALQRIFENQPLDYKITDGIITITAAKSENKKSVAEKKELVTVSGKVIDEKGTPIAGATLRVKGTNKIVVTDGNGHFGFSIPSFDYTIQIDCIGFISVEQQAMSTIVVILNRSESILDEVIAIAYGSTTKRLNTGSVAKISSKEIESQPVSNPLAAIIGRVPGADVIQNNGVPGSTFSIQIRGRNSLAQGSEPLFIIDGVPFAPNNSNIALQTSIANGLSPFSSINPNDIESIEILKDADATAIYGSRGANGVVLITTKKGKAGGTQLTIRHSQGINDLAKKMKMLNTSEYLQLREEAFANDQITPSATPGTDGYAPDLMLWDKNRYTNLRGLIMGQTANTMNSSLNLSGGSEKTQFLVGGSFNSETTVFTGDSKYKKGTVNLNINHRTLKDRLEMAFSTNYSLESNRLFNGNALYYSNLSPNLPALYSSDGSLNWSENGASFYNPVAFTRKEFNSYRKNLIARMQLSYAILKNLDLKTSFGYNDLRSDEKAYDPLSTQDPSGDTYQGSVQYANNAFSSWIIEPQLDYSMTRGKNLFHITIGGSLQKTLNEAQSFKASGYANDQLLKSLAAATTLSNPFNSYAPYKYAAAFARINYNFDNKYLLNLSGRRDGSSRFGPDNQWGNFYAIGAGWIFSNEGFLADEKKILSLGKLRTSYGITGNDQIGNYQYLDTWSPWRAYQGIPALYPSGLFNPDYGWEVNKKYEAALETAWFRERLIFNLAFFLNRSGNQLVQYVLPSQTGHFSINRNFPALIENKGWEAELNVKIFNGRNFSWETGANITIPKNRLLKFENLENSAYRSKYVIGESLNVIYGYRSLGVNPETGVYDFQDTNGDATFNILDYTVLGTRDPKFYGGWSNTLRYKGVTLNTFFQFKKQTGTTILNEIYANSQSFPGMMFNQPDIVLDRWQKPGDRSIIQKVSATTASDAYRIANDYIMQSDAVFGNASFIRLKTVELAYTIPSEWLKKIGACSIFFQGQNLLTISNYKGWDPETQGSVLAIPPLRSFVFGLSLNY